MTDCVIPVDFGKERREFEDKLFRLLGVVERQKDELRADPVRLYGMAVDEIVKLHRFIEELYEANRYPLLDWRALDDVVLSPCPTMVVRREDYDRMKRVDALIERGPKAYD